MNAESIQHVDERRLEKDLAYRFRYLADFIGFGAEDVQALHAAAPHLAPLVPVLVDLVYDKLFAYDATKRHFVARQHGYEGPVPTTMGALTQDHEMIRFRKKHLGNYLGKLVSADYDDKMVAYLDLVGKMHTPKAGSPQLSVPLVQMNALLGFVADVIMATILELHIDCPTKVRTLRAFNKLLWLQNDLIVRHYAI